jgi:hypothetical protein
VHRLGIAVRALEERAFAPLCSGIRYRKVHCG